MAVCFVRRAVVADLDVMYDFELRYMEEFEAENLQRWKDAREGVRKQFAEALGQAFVAEVGGQVVGYSYWSMHEGQAGVFSIYCDEEFRRSGVATSLLKAVEVDCKEAGHKYIYLSTRIINPAQHFFAFSGYIEINRKEGWINYQKCLEE